MSDRIFERFVHAFGASPPTEHTLVLLLLAVSVLPLWNALKTALMGPGRFERTKMLLEMRKIVLETKVLMNEKSVALPIHEERAVMGDWEKLVAEPLLSVPGDHRLSRYATATLWFCVGGVVTALGQLASLKVATVAAVPAWVQFAIFAIVGVVSAAASLWAVERIAVRINGRSKLCGQIARLGGSAFIVIEMWVVMQALVKVFVPSQP